MPTDSPPRWHPILAAVEGPPATWRMADPLGREYAVIELRRVAADAVRYRVTVGGEVLGYATSLRLAAERAHGVYLASHAPPSPYTRDAPPTRAGPPSPSPAWADTLAGSPSAEEPRP